MIPSGHVMELPISIYKPEQVIEDLWHKSLTPNFRRISGPKSDPSLAGAAFTSVSLSAPDYLNHLYLKALKLGIKFVRKSFDSIFQPFESSRGLDFVPIADLVVNATGLGARHLKGVEDDKVMPIRGQTVVVDCPNVKECVMSISQSKDGESAYIIPRPNGQAILGGCFQINNWNTNVDEDMSQRILKSCFELNNNLSPTGRFEDIKVVRHNVGLRPAREGGTRLELEMIKSQNDYFEEQLPVVHAYGIGPAGFQCSWGMAEDVSNLIDEHFKTNRNYLEPSSSSPAAKVLTYNNDTNNSLTKSSTTPRSCPSVSSSSNRPRASSQRWIPKSPIITPQTVLI